MSKIGKRILLIDKDTSITYDKNVVRVVGKHGELDWKIPQHNFNIEITSVDVKVYPHSPRKLSIADKCMWGTINARIKWMLDGVHEPFVKKLQIVGVGNRCKMNESQLTFKLGFSHLILLEIPKNVKVVVMKQTSLTVSSPDKELLGSFCAKIRALAPPEPYLGKGIRYIGESFKRKIGKRVGK